jgi:hypothetical protein
MNSNKAQIDLEEVQQILKNPKQTQSVVTTNTQKDLIRVRSF